MLIPKEMLVRATELSLTEVKAALVANGYTDNADLRGTEFKGMNSTGAYVYGIEFGDDDEEDLISEGYIYVKIRRKAMSKDFEFYAEY